MSKALSVVLCVALTVVTGCANPRSDSSRQDTQEEVVPRQDGVEAAKAIALWLNNNPELKPQLLPFPFPPHPAMNFADFNLRKSVHIADCREHYATREDWLEACIFHSQEINLDLTKCESKIKRIIATTHKKTTELVAAYKRHELDNHALEKEIKNIEAQQKRNEKVITLLQEEISKLKTVIADAREHNNFREADILEHEIARMEPHIAPMRDAINKLASMSRRLSI